MTIDNIAGPEQAPMPPTSAPSQVLTLTEAAAVRVRHLLAQKTPEPEAVIVSVTSKGCSGLRYDLQYLDRLSDKPKFADVVTQHGVTVVVDPKATLYIIGSTMDYVETPTRSGFDFVNPNETGRCGCGESFSVT